MPSQDSVGAAMRVFTVLMSAPGDEAELFATTLGEATSELPGGFEELTAGLLQVVAVLTRLVADNAGTTDAQVVRAVGVALAARP